VAIEALPRKSQRRKEIHPPCDGDILRKNLFDAVSGLDSKPPPKGSVAGHFRQRLRPFDDEIGMVDKNPADPILDDLADATRVRRDDGEAAGHHFQESEWRIFKPDARHHAEIAGLKQTGQPRRIEAAD